MNTEIGLVSFVILGVVIILVFTVVQGTRKKDKAGVNLKKVSCPACDKELPRARRPTSLKQVMWGGYTCPACGVDIDKWGRREGAA